MSAADCDIDVLIFGGGVAGLWTLRRLLARGFSTLLLERDALGAGQTIASQGIIHGGLKYTLGSAGGAAAAAIAGMPARWKACLEGGEGAELDLREARVLSPCQYLFTAPGFAARIAGAAASKVIRTEVVRIAPGAGGGGRPEGLAGREGAPASCDVYRVAEPVLEPRSILAALAAGAVGRLGRMPARARVSFEGEEDGEIVASVTSPGGGTLRVRARGVVLAAGAGNGALLEGFGRAADERAVEMQRRPLHMVMARSPRLPMLYAHCVDASSRPRVTITSQRDGGGRTVWTIGGDLAEAGVQRDGEAQVAAAREELARVMPWVDLEEAEFATFRIDRAEGRSGTGGGGGRPDLPTVAPATQDGRVLAVWPTKLAFAPLVAEQVEAHLREVGIVPRGGEAPCSAAAIGLPTPGIAALPWEREDLPWS